MNNSKGSFFQHITGFKNNPNTNPEPNWKTYLWYALFWFVGGLLFSFFAVLATVALLPTLIIFFLSAVSAVCSLGVVFSLIFMCIVFAVDYNHAKNSQKTIPKPNQQLTQPRPVMPDYKSQQSTAKKQ